MRCEECLWNGILTAKDKAFGRYFDDWANADGYCGGSWGDEPVCYRCFMSDLTDMEDFVEYMEKE